MSTIFNDSKKLRSFLVILVIGLIVFIVADCAHDRRKNQDVADWRELAYGFKTKAEYWRNEDWKSRARANVAEADVKNLADAYAEEFRRIRKEFGIKERNFKNATMVSTSVTDTVEVHVRDTVYVQDTTKIKARVFQFRDRWVTINGQLFANTALVTYALRDSLTLAQSVYRKNWFALRELRIDAISSNPHSTITGLKSISVRPPQRSRIGIGPFVGVGITGKPLVGIGVHFDFIQL